jgi:hypothetical protein
MKISPNFTQNDEVSGSKLEYSISDPMDLNNSRASIEEEDVFWLENSVDQGQRQLLDQTTPDTKEACHSKTHSRYPNTMALRTFDKATQTTLTGELKLSRLSLVLQHFTNKCPA